MGYACPVCSDPQADAGHLANHLAFTAILGDEDHEAWLDEHAPGWEDAGEDDLAGTVADRVEETEFPQLFEDTAGGLASDSGEPPGERSGALFGEGHDHEHGHNRASERARGATGGGQLDETAEAVLEEARELTRRMYAGEDAGDGADGESGTDDAE